MQNCFSLLDTDVMPIFMIIALDIFITMRFSINCSAVICSPTVIHAILREATSETYGPRVSFLLYCISFIYITSHLLFCNLYFPIYTTKIPKIFTLPFIYLYQISLLRVTVKDWQPLYRVGCKFLISCAGIQWLVCRLLLDWYLGSQNWGKYLHYFAASPFPLQGKNQRKLNK